MKEKKEGDPSRRSFLLKNIGAVAGTVVGASMLASCKHTESPETGEKVKLLDVNGNLVEVDKGHLLCCTTPSSKDVRKGIPGRHFVMVIDLSRCRNARKCV